MLILTAGFGEGHNAAARNLAAAIEVSAGPGSAHEEACSVEVSRLRVREAAEPLEAIRTNGDQAVLVL